jgi:F-type H+-transporting ATPase subunit alpha
VNVSVKELGRALLDARLDVSDEVRLRGVVVEVGDGVAQVVGLPEVGYEELVVFDSGACGMAYDLAPERTGVVLLVSGDGVAAGEGAEGMGRLPSIPVGPNLLGRIVDPLGAPIDERPPPAGQSRPVFVAAPDLVVRAPVCRQLLTGVLAIDTAIPVGRGQRQLIIGDRNVGKTALALDIVSAQKNTGVVCVYVMIGQPLSRVLSVRDALLASGAWDNTVIVAAEASEAPGIQYLAPYAGTAVAESFRDAGRDALVVYDDLTKHADAYRELALLLNRPPGREAFPGDIFYIHAELLERATVMSDASGGGSLTALPIVETTDGDISSYIPTNLISITDGQVYLDATRFEKNQRPAVDVGRSVSRVGGTAQPDVLRRVARNVRIATARFDTLEAFTRVGLDVDPKTQLSIDRGRALRELNRQPRFTLRSLAAQILALLAVDGGWLDGLAASEARDLVWRSAERARAELASDSEALDRGQEPAAGWQERLQQLVQRERSLVHAS